MRSFGFSRKASGYRLLKRTRRSQCQQARPRQRAFELLEPRLAVSVTILNETFQSDVVGTQPNSTDQFWNATGPESYIQVAGTGGTYVPPFGGSTNKALDPSHPGHSTLEADHPKHTATWRTAVCSRSWVSVVQLSG